MDTKFLESFLIVAECGSVAEAARRLNMTPAAVAQRIRALETELGQALVSRVGRTVRPTAAGLAVQRHGPALVRMARDLRAIAAGDLPSGQLRLGATATAMTGLIPQITAALSERFRQIDYFLQPGSSVNLYHAVLSGELDAALIIEPQFPIPKAFGWSTIRREPLVLLAPADLEIHDFHLALTQQPFIRYDRNQWGGQIVDRYLRRHAISVREWAELDALDAIAALVDRGLGVALVPDWAPPWPEGLRLQKHRMEDGELRNMGVLWANSGPRIAAIRAFVEACEGISKT
ncbi:DNA-binding transcriptional LysR family regulator [Rhizobium sp. ERR 922]|uniref:LysR family transcriptional regulator n=1 Tax=unclassified Rhizobium TaxID=2613769 RepID=UPI0011A68E16|nr:MULTISPECIES: LysR family transcriptional regulator [unclassified Rhizobium]TWB53705.1 DNA-binding transcriptional LysR family regulator [Rhizobium sp. ERR 922]TWB95331.1 DNA-binding transcriptional LysR family regulator [Rhizobium sp. ERR 942]